MEKRSNPTTAYAALIITAAGSSRRMGAGEKKEYRSLNGRPVLVQTLLPFLQSGLFSQVVITIPPGHGERVESLLQQLPQEFHNWIEKIILIEGGASRQASVFAGLEACSCNPRFVLIHDGARPRTSAMLIRRVLFDTEENGASIPVVASTDAMKQITSDGFIQAHLPRQATVCAQTPQGFAFQEILSAHRQAENERDDFIDDAEVYARYIGRVHTVEGEKENLKLTYPDDFHIHAGPNLQPTPHSGSPGDHL
ncbi:MAG: 2-C-methyl-D-erythritol 4-phosphate cytidylyltransferase [Spirochaetota bacterium]